MIRRSPYGHPEIAQHIEEIARLCRRVRRLRNWTAFGVVTLAATALVTLALYLLPAPGQAGTAILVVYLLMEALAAWKWLFAPIRRKITAEQIALFIDEQHPEYENRVVTALELSSREHPEASRWIIERFLDETEPLVKTISFSELVDVRSPRRMGALTAATILASLWLITAFNALWFPSFAPLLPGDTAQYVPLPFTVEPGNARVRRGDNQMIWVHSDRPYDKVFILWRTAAGEWQSAQMERSGAENVHFHQFFNVQEDIQYTVRLERRQSETYQLTAWTPPRVDSIDLVYHYPDYLGLPSREVPNSGHIIGVEGSKVDLAVWVNKKLKSAELVFGSGSRAPLTEKAEGLWTGSIELTKNDQYQVDLLDLEAAKSEYNTKYSITVERDRPPQIRIEFPRGDSEVSMIEEVPFDFKVTDDYGFKEFGLQYEIAGRGPVRVPLYDSPTAQIESKGHHTIRLEELGLEPGDFITWTIWANDAKPDRSEYASLGDPYFLEVRPFRRTYQESISGSGADAGAGAGMQGADQDPAMVQKQIIIATWNVRRDAPGLEEPEFNDRIKTIVETQEELANRLAGGDAIIGQANPDVLRLRQAMEQSVTALASAKLPSPEKALSDAAVAQQQAYRLILKLTPDQQQVQRQMGGAGGGGGGRGGERPDIQALELARNRNFYEQENLTQEQQQAANEALNKIKELAKRQQVLNEEIAKLISEMAQAKDEREREELRRRLERLEEEQQRNLDRLDEIQQQIGGDRMDMQQAREAREALDQARRQMNRSLDQLRNEELQQARASGARAMDALGEIEEYLQQFSRAAAAQRMRELLDEMKDLQNQQNDIQRMAREVQEKHNSPSLDTQKEVEQGRDQIMQQKSELAREFTEMMERAAELAERARDSQELMSRNLGDWLRETAREGILEDIQETQRLVRHGAWETAVMAEGIIGRKMDDAAHKLEEVAQSLVEDDVEAMQKALEQLDELLRQTPEEIQRLARGFNPGDRPERPSDEPVGRPAQAPDENTQEQGQTPGEPGDNSEQQAAEQGQQGQQGQPGQQGQQGQSGGVDQQGGADAPGFRPGIAPDRRPAGGDRWGGNLTGPGGWTGPLGPLDMRRFAEEDYLRWLERLRNAEALLPQDLPYRTQVGRIREEIEAIRRQWRERANAPRFDLFLDAVARPLAQTAEELQREIQRLLSEKEFVLVDEGEIPERYREKVADYFKNLSQIETKE